MSCEICGRNNCIRSFHSIEAQNEFDNVADGIKERMRNTICKRLEKLNGEYIEDVYYIKLSDAVDIVENY
jgi:hypothetical protein